MAVAHLGGSSCRVTLSSTHLATPRSRQQPDGREVAMFKVIIWATDGSSAAAQALPYAKGLAG